MKRIYVAGSYSCAGRCEPLGVDLISMKKGIEASIKVLKFGMAPFCPWLDYLFVLMDRDQDLPEKWYYDYSCAFLLACDAMLLLNYRNNSFGVDKELDLAKKHDIPVFWSFADLVTWKERGEVR